MIADLVNPNAEGLVMAALPGGFKPGGSVTTDQNGQPRRRYLKDLVRVGEFTRRSDGRQYRIDAKLLSQLEASTKKYIAAGNKVTMPDGHDHTGSADRNRGYVVDVFVEGDTLYGVVDAVGDDAIRAASRSHVSIFAPKRWSDSQGNTYEWPIVHLALTTDPVVAPQNDFVAIAASNGRIQAEFVEPKQESVMDWKQLGQALGLSVELTEDNAEAEIRKAIEAAQATVPENTDRELSQAREKIAELESAKGDAIELSATERGMGRRMVNERAESLVKGGHLTPAQRDKLVPQLTGDADLQFDQSGDSCRALRILDTFADNTVIALGEQTGAQVVELAQTAHGSEKIELSEDDVNEFVRLAGAEQ